MDISPEIPLEKFGRRRVDRARSLNAVPVPMGTSIFRETGSFLNPAGRRPVSLT